jgi:hypothetical protein
MQATTGSKAELDPVGIGIALYIPGILAAMIGKARENGKPKRATLADFLASQNAFNSHCARCSRRVQLELFDRDDAERFWQLVKGGAGEVMREEIKHRYETYVFTCPECGNRGRLPTRVP